MLASLVGPGLHAAELSVQLQDQGTASLVSQDDGFSQLSLHLQHRDPGALVFEDATFAWRRVRNGVTEYWDGSHWQNTLQWLVIGAASRLTPVDDEAGRLVLRVDDRGSAFWDGVATLYAVKVRETRADGLHESGWTPVNLEFAALPAPTGLDVSFFADGRFRVSWDLPAGVPPEAYFYRLGVQKVSDGRWMDPNWKNNAIFEASVVVDGSRLEPETAYQLVLYRFRNNSANPVGSNFPATLEIIHRRPTALAPLNQETMGLLPVTAYSNVSVAERGEGAEPFQVTTTEPLPHDLNLTAPGLSVSGSRFAFFGIRDRFGRWLNPHWRRLPGGLRLNMAYMLGSERLRPNETYDIVMHYGDRHQRTPELLLAQMTYRPPVSSSAMPAPLAMPTVEAGAFSLHSTMTDAETVAMHDDLQVQDLQVAKDRPRTPIYSGPSPWFPMGGMTSVQYIMGWVEFFNLPERLAGDDIRVLVLSDGLFFDGEQWIAHDRNDPDHYGFTFVETLQRDYFGILHGAFRGDPTNLVFHFMWPGNGASFANDFIKGLGDNLTLGWQVLGERQEIALDVGVYKPFVVDQTHYIINGRDAISFRVSVHPSFREHSEHIQWVWRDEDTGEMWDGRQWLASGDQTPWSLVYQPRLGAVSPDRPGLELTHRDDSFQVTYQLGPHRDLFFNGRERRRLRLFFRQENMGTDLLNNLFPFTEILTFDNLNARFSLALGVDRWGLTTDPTLAEVVLTDGELQPEAVGLSSSLEILPGSGVPADWKLVLRLYEPDRDGGYRPLFTSVPTPLPELAGEQGAAVLSRAFQSLLRESDLPTYIPASATVYPSSLVPRPPNRTYRLAAFLVSNQTHDALNHARYQPELPLPGMQVRLRVAGHEIGLLHDEQGADFTTATLPVQYRTLPDRTITSFSHRVNGEGVAGNLPRPWRLQGRAAANLGDQLVPRVATLVPWVENAAFSEAFPEGTFAVFRLDPDSSEPSLIEVRPAGNGLLFDDLFLPDTAYRVIYEGRDPCGMRVRAVQDFGSIRSLDRARVGFAFGGADSQNFNHPVLETSLTRNLNLNYSVDYPGFVGTGNHRFALRAGAVTREVWSRQHNRFEVVPVTQAGVVFNTFATRENASGRPEEYQAVLNQALSAINFCTAQDLNQTVPVHLATLPYPISVRQVAVVDQLTGRNYPLADASLTLNYGGSLTCPTPDFEPNTLGTIGIAAASEDLVWRYGAADLHDFALQTHVKFKTEDYQSAVNQWQLRLTFLSEDGLQQRSAGMPLVDYLAATGQAMPTTGLTEVAQPLLVLPKVIAENWWALFQQNGWVDFRQAPDASTRVRLHINLVDTQGNFLARSSRLHGAGIAIDLRPGEPPQGRPLTHMTYQTISPDRVMKREGDGVALVMTQTLAVNPSVRPDQVNNANFRWRWRSELGYFNGQAWQSAPADLAVGQAPMFTQSFARIGWQNGLPRLLVQASLPATGFPVGFKPEGRDQLTLHLELVYLGQNGDSSLVAEGDGPANRLQINWVPAGTGTVATPRLRNSGLSAADQQQPFQPLLEEITPQLRDALANAFAPEPMVLKPRRLDGAGNQTWVLGGSAQDDMDLTQTPTNLEALGVYAWLTVPVDPFTDSGSHRVFVVPYPDHKDGGPLPFQYAARQAVSLQKAATTWRWEHNLFYRYRPPCSDRGGAFHICVFVPQSRLERSPLGEGDEDFWRKNPRLNAFLEGDDPSNWGESETHNRVVSMTYPNPENPQQRIVSIDFFDLIGRYQETRTMATHVPFDWIDRVGVSGARRYDALGRVSLTAKPFEINDYENGRFGMNTVSSQGRQNPPPAALVGAGGAARSFEAAIFYWGADAQGVGNRERLNHLVGRDPFAYTETVYERDSARGRMLAEIPAGSQARNAVDPLRHHRFHYFTLPVFDLSKGGTPPAAAKLLFDQLAVHQAFTIMPFDDLSVPVVQGRLSIDPNGLMHASLMDAHGTAFVEIGNPSVDLLRSWGFGVRIGDSEFYVGDKILHQNTVIELPADYHDRVAANDLSSGDPTGAGEWRSDLNVFTFTEVDAEDRVTAVWPPKALNLQRGGEGEPWRLTPASGQGALCVRHQYDGQGRLAATIAPDHGRTEYVYDRLGRPRLVRHAGDIARNQWLESVYDRLGRLVQTRIVSFPGISTQQQQTLQRLFIVGDPVRGIPADDQALPEEGVSTADYRVRVNAESVVQYLYGEYDLFNQRHPWSDTFREGAYWPTIQSLEQAYPWDYDGLLFAEPLDQRVEIMADQSAERFYYDFKGRLICRVQLIRGVLEPQVTWTRYDHRDLPVARYNQTHHLGTGFAYDPFGRLAATHDLAPLSERMRLRVRYRHEDTPANEPAEAVVAVLGPLVDEGSNLALEDTARQLAVWDFAVTGHVREVVYGGDGAAPISNRFTYDVRDWLLGQEVAVDGVPAYSLALDYFGLGGLLQGEEETRRMFDGTVAALSETFHLEGVAGETTQHAYRYDGVYQLTEATQQRDSLLIVRYGYDRNGNRIRENRSGYFSPRSEVPYQANLVHDFHTGTNRLRAVRKDWDAPNNEPRYENNTFDYDSMGNVTGIQRYKDVDSSLEVDQVFAYEDPRFLHQPTRLTQTLYGGDAEGSGFATEIHRYRYDHDGTRIFRAVEKPVGPPETTFFVPHGLENAAELDGWGRARRVYLFNGAERLGYKSKRNSGLYIKDHLGSTKMVVALNRDPVADAQPSSGSETPGEPSVTPSPQTLVDLDFEGSLINRGTLGEGAFMGEPNYLARDGQRGLWFDRDEALRFPNHADVEQLTQGFTIALWAYDSDEDDGSWDSSTMVAVGAGLSIRHNPVHFYLDGGKLPVLRLGGGAEGWRYFSRFSPLPQKTWVHLAVSFDGTHVRCYQNGELLGEPESVDLTALFPAQDVVVGDWPGHEDYAWHGGLDAVWITTRAEADPAIRDHYLRSAPDAPMRRAPAAAPPVDAPAKERARSLFVLSRVESDPFGVSLIERYQPLAGDLTEPHQFTGQEVERSLGLLYMNGRWYLAEVGRFLQADPMRQYWNSYSYVGNNPINRIDPTGLQDEQMTIVRVQVLQGDRWVDLDKMIEGSGMFTMGAMNGFGSNMMMGLGREEVDHFWFQVGQGVGDIAAALAGSGMMMGGAMAIGGVAIATAGGPILLAGGVVAGGIIVAGYGFAVMTQGSKNFAQNSYDDITHSYSKGSGRSPRGSNSGSPEEVPHQPGHLPDDALVLRGGQSLPENFEKGSGVVKGPDGKLDQVSVNSAAGKSTKELTKTIRNGQVGQTTVGNVRKAGGDVVPSPNVKNPDHATLSGLTGDEASSLMRPTTKNPTKKK
ncbi:RHS repeat-associated core domain-containing protein [Acanthopleuribacter pedis]|uniref:Fibronectin type-III domain-containing protein n=1 Tax=Acanthopleuribacter pedis TaxID=442870 RepID=A0A8J7QI03_9BACT|nr:RHS repeat-associated core domain-containing protein [Acanthopleuribacter pedis]MBO1320675.1 hypothetical protein [Acanthopleuribacter pedis]